MKKVPLIEGKTNIQKLKYHINNTVIYMKRDDLIDFAFGGNKVRLFEYIAADIISKGAEKIITFGSIYSNHIRVAASVATLLGISCDLILLYEDSEKKEAITPNLRLVNYCKNVHIEYCQSDEAHAFIDEYLEVQKASGVNFYWIPGGGHTAIAAQGYVDAAHEITKQLQNIKIDALFLPCGTGTTQAGLVAGLEGKIPVYGITVARTVNRCKDEISKLLEQMQGDEITAGGINILPCSIKYGENNKSIEEIITELVHSDGIFLDPVYNAKSFLTMVQFIKVHPEIKAAVYVNTGGTPNLF